MVWGWQLPKAFSIAKKTSTHSIFVPEHQICLPLYLRGAVSLLDSWTPTQYELEHCKWVYLTNDEEWDPHSREQLQGNEERIGSTNYTQSFERNICAIYRQINSFSDITNLMDDSWVLKTTCIATSKSEMSIESLATKKRYFLTRWSRHEQHRRHQIMIQSMQISLRNWLHSSWWQILSTSGNRSFCS